MTWCFDITMLHFLNLNIWWDVEYFQARLQYNALSYCQCLFVFSLTCLLIYDACFVHQIIMSLSTKENRLVKIVNWVDFSTSLVEDQISFNFNLYAFICLHMYVVTYVLTSPIPIISLTLTRFYINLYFYSLYTYHHLFIL